MEACGLLAGRQGTATRLYNITNILQSPYHFEMDMREVGSAWYRMEQRQEEWMAIYHSHPTGICSPSPGDIAQSHYPDQVYIIVSLANHPPTLCCFLIRFGTVTRIPHRFI
jgi:proteasome lid subunit RPN8/RPN11